MRLVLGVVDLPYADAASYRALQNRNSPSRNPNSSITTGDVAEILEKNYKVMETFWDIHGQDIADVVANSYAGAAESVMQGAPLRNIDPFASANEDIKETFKRAIENREFDGRQPGIPTMAAQQGHSKRFKQPYKKRAPRPSFRDTGLYQAAFTTWTID